MITPDCSAVWYNTGAGKLNRMVIATKAITQITIAGAADDFPFMNRYTGGVFSARSGGNYIKYHGIDGASPNSMTFTPKLSGAAFQGIYYLAFTGAINSPMYIFGFVTGGGTWSLYRIPAGPYTSGSSPAATLISTLGGIGGGGFPPWRWMQVRYGRFTFGSLYDRTNHRIDLDGSNFEAISMPLPAGFASYNIVRWIHDYSTPGGYIAFYTDYTNTKVYRGYFLDLIPSGDTVGTTPINLATPTLTLTPTTAMNTASQVIVTCVGGTTGTFTLTFDFTATADPVTKTYTASVAESVTCTAAAVTGDTRFMKPAAFTFTTIPPNDGSTGVPNDGSTGKPNDGSTGVPNDGSTGVPNDGSTGKPNDGSTGVPNDGSTGVPNDGSTGIPNDGSTGVPNDGSTGKPNDGSTGVPNDGSTGKPNDGSTGVPNDGSTGKPNDGSTGVPNDGSTGKPNDGSTGVPNDGSTGKPNDGSTGPAPVHASTAIIGGEITSTIGLYAAIFVGTTSTCNTFVSWDEGSNRRMFVQSTLAGASTETVLVDVNAGGQFGHCEPVSAIK